jgi:hypothetical protein
MSEILKELDKYFIYAVSSKKSILLAKSNSKTQLRKLALDKLEINSSMSKDRIDKYNGLYLYRIKLMKVHKKDYEMDKKSKIKMIGGPIVAVVERVQINITNNIKLKSIDEDTTNNKIYFSPIYLKKYKTIKEDSINKIALDFAHKKFNSSLFAVNTINL